MQKNVNKIRVIYADTDAMGIVYHTNYIKWFEIGRNEFMREFDFKYTEIEETGFSLPVTEVVCHFLVSAKYDDIVLIETTLGFFRRTNIKFEYEIWDEKRETLLSEGSTLHSFVKDGKITRPPDVFAAKLTALMEQKNKNSVQEKRNVDFIEKRNRTAGPFYADDDCLYGLHADAPKEDPDQRDRRCAPDGCRRRLVSLRQEK